MPVSSGPQSGSVSSGPLESESSSVRHQVRRNALPAQHRPIRISQASSAAARRAGRLQHGKPAALGRAGPGRKPEGFGRRKPRRFTPVRRAHTLPPADRAAGSAGPAGSGRRGRGPGRSGPGAIRRRPGGTPPGRASGTLGAAASDVPGAAAEGVGRGPDAHDAPAPHRHLVHRPRRPVPRLRPALR